jgi:hypothetical protein
MTEHILTANEKFANAVGYDYGPASNEVQAELLNGFARSLNVACLGKPETQISYIVDRLSHEAKKVFTELSEMIRVHGEMGL